MDGVITLGSRWVTVASGVTASLFLFLGFGVVKVTKALSSSLSNSSLCSFSVGSEEKRLFIGMPGSCSEAAAGLAEHACADGALNLESARNIVEPVFFRERARVGYSCAPR